MAKLDQLKHAAFGTKSMFTGTITLQHLIPLDPPEVYEFSSVVEFNKFNPKKKI